jgi:PEP-CTERM motif-containing protein
MQNQLFTLALAAGLAIASTGTARADIQFTGTTTGSLSPTVTGLTFAGTGISALVPIGGSATLADIGTFTLSCPGGNCGSIPASTFTLTFTFSLPTVSPNQTFSANVSGKVNVNQTNTVSNATIDFNNTAQTVAYTTTGGSGTFDLAVTNDPTVSSNTRNPTQSQTVTGLISNVTFTPTPVPEPATIGMLVGVLGFVGIAMRRRQKA